MHFYIVARKEKQMGGLFAEVIGTRGPIKTKFSHKNDVYVCMIIRSYDTGPSN